MLQVADNSTNAQLATINSTLTSLQNQINAIPAPVIIEAGGVQYLPKTITFFGHPMTVGWFPQSEELVLTFY